MKSLYTKRRLDPLPSKYWQKFQNKTHQNADFPVTANKSEYLRGKIPK